LPHGATALQIGQNHGLQLFALLRSLKPRSSAKLAMPLQSRRPVSFCPLSSEAYLLTGKIRLMCLFLIGNKVCHPEERSIFFDKPIVQ